MYRDDGVRVADRFRVANGTSVDIRLINIFSFDKFFFLSTFCSCNFLYSASGYIRLSRKRLGKSSNERNEETPRQTQRSLGEFRTAGHRRRHRQIFVVVDRHEEGTSIVHASRRVRPCDSPTNNSMNYELEPGLTSRSHRAPGRRELFRFDRRRDAQVIVNRSNVYVNLRSNVLVHKRDGKSSLKTYIFHRSTL